MKEKVTGESLTPGATSENINQIDDRIKLTKIETKSEVNQTISKGPRNTGC